eukprot:17926-Heterococcus_DN1.PRE.1
MSCHHTDGVSSKLFSYTVHRYSIDSQCYAVACYHAIYLESQHKLLCVVFVWFHAAMLLMLYAAAPSVWACVGLSTHSPCRGAIAIPRAHHVSLRSLYTDSTSDYQLHYTSTHYTIAAYDLITTFAKCAVPFGTEQYQCNGELNVAAAESNDIESVAPQQQQLAMLFSIAQELTKHLGQQYDCSASELTGATSISDSRSLGVSNSFTASGIELQGALYVLASTWLTTALQQTSNRAALSWSNSSSRRVYMYNQNTNTTL